MTEAARWGDARAGYRAEEIRRLKRIALRDVRGRENVPEAGAKAPLERGHARIALAVNLHRVERLHRMIEDDVDRRWAFSCQVDSDAFGFVADGADLD